MLEGSCNCGAVRFEARGKVWGISACHCGQCRKQSGGVWHSAVSQQQDLQITGEPRWYRSNPHAQRGFCANCGTFLFWKHDDETSMSFAMGALDAPSGRTLEKHIFVAGKGDYYEIADGVPQKEQ
ncbi:MAG: GFA family protein [Pseudomonadota bacterium]